MTWTMPAEWAPQDRVWMAFPRVGNTLGDDAASADEARDTWAAVANAAAGFEPVTMVVDPSAVGEARTPPVGRDRARRGAARRLLDARHRTDLRARRRRRARRGRLDLQRLGRERVGDVGARRPDRRASSPSSPGAMHLPSPLVNEGGGIHVDGEGTVLLTETVQLDPRRNPYATKERVEWELHRTIGATTFIWLPRGLTRDYESAGTRGHVDMVATFAAPGRRAAALAGRPVAPRLRGRAAGPRGARRGDGCRGPQSRVHRPARPDDAARRGGLRRLELRQPPRRERRRDRVRLRRAGGRRPRRRHPRRRLRPRGRDDRRAADPAAGWRHPLHHAAAAVDVPPIVERCARGSTRRFA